MLHSVIWTAADAAQELHILAVTWATCKHIVNATVSVVTPQRTDGIALVNMCCTEVYMCTSQNADSTSHADVEL